MSLQFAMTPTSTSEHYGHLLSSAVVNVAQLSAKELSWQQKENGFRKRRLEIEKKEIALQHQAQDLDLEKRTLENDHQAFALKKEKDKQSQQNPTAVTRRAIAKTTTRGGSRGAATKKAVAGHTKAKPGPKPNPKGKLRLSGNGIKIEDDDDEYRGPVTKKRSSTHVLQGHDTLALSKSDADQVSGAAKF
jgi:hypothetical protein